VVLDIFSSGQWGKNDSDRLRGPERRAEEKKIGDGKEYAKLLEDCTNRTGIKSQGVH